MTPGYRLLGRHRRERVREIARHSYLVSPVQAAEYAEQSVRREYSGILATFFVGLAVKLAIELIKYWIEKQISTPAGMYAADEPGAES